MQEVGSSDYKVSNVGETSYIVLDWSEAEILSLKMDSRIEEVVSGKFGTRMADIKRNTLIVGIKRWGDNVANHISDTFGISEIRSLGIRSYDRDFKRGAHRVYQQLDVEEDLSSYDLIIFADGVVDSGSTLKLATEMIQKYSPKAVISATLLVKSHARLSSDAYGDKVDGGLWVAFPWEKSEISRKVVRDLKNLGHNEEEIAESIERNFGYDSAIIDRVLKSETH